MRYVHGWTLYKKCKLPLMAGQMLASRQPLLGNCSMRYPTTVRTSCTYALPYYRPSDPHGKDCSYNPVAFSPSMEVRCGKCGKCKEQFSTLAICSIGTSAIRGGRIRAMHGYPARIVPVILLHFLHPWRSYVTYQGKALAFAEEHFLIKIQRRIFLFSLAEIK